jgi:hypothetical protein
VRNSQNVANRVMQAPQDVNKLALVEARSCTTRLEL